MRSPLPLLSLLALRCIALACLALLPCACAPSVDGGWEGDAVCSGDAFPVSAILDQNSDREVEGVVYIEQILGAFIVRGNVEDGEVRDDGEVRFDLNTDDDDAPEFEIAVTFDEDDADRVAGDVDVLRDDGSVQDTCDLDLDRATVQN